MPRKRTANKQRRSESSAEATGFYIFYREWPGWNLNSDFPFDRFNSLPDDQIEEALTDFAENECQEYATRLSEESKKRAGQMISRPTPRVPSVRRQLRETELECLSLDDLKGEAARRNIDVRETKAETIAVILAADDAEHRAVQDKREKDASERIRAEAEKMPPILLYVRVAGWARFPQLVDGERVASLRQYVLLVNSREEAGELAEALQHRFHTGRCLRFGYVAESEFSLSQRIKIQRITEDLLTRTDVPPEAGGLQTIVREAAKIVKTREEIVKRDEVVERDGDSGEGARGSARRMSGEAANAKARELLDKDPGFRDMTLRQWAEKLECSTGLVSTLPVWRAIQQEKRKSKATTRTQSPSAVTLTDTVLVVTGEDNDPSDAADIDAVLSKLLEDASPEERAKIHEMSEDERRELAVAAKQQIADDEPSPLEEDPRDDRDRRRRVIERKRV